jgi:Protein of unknown function (DUF4054)
VPFTIPTVSDFKSQFSRDFPYAVPAYGASGIASINISGVVTSISLGAGGFGYATVPTVIVGAAPGDLGTGATATASIAGGQVTGFTVTNGGSNYGQPPIITITGGAGDPSDLSKVTDNDISGAIFDAQFNINEALFPTQQFFSRAFLYLAAHQLVEKLLAAQEGMGSQYSWLTVSKSIDSVTEGFQIPERIAQDPMLSHFSKTRYGAMYLQIISPQLIANVFVAFRETLP